MDMNFTADEIAFEQGVAAFVQENLPPDIKDKVDRGIELTREEVRRWMEILGKQGWAATNWDKKDGGPGFTIAEKFLAEDAIFMNGAPKMVHFGTRMVGPVLLAFGTPRKLTQGAPMFANLSPFFTTTPQGGETLCQLASRNRTTATS